MDSRPSSANRGFFAGDLRQMIPAWKPTPNNAVQRYNLCDNGSMGFAVLPSAFGSSLKAVPVKQNNDTCFSAASTSAGLYPTPFVPPSFDVFTVDELQMRKTSAMSATLDESSLKRMLRQKLTIGKMMKNNAQLLEELKSLSKKLAEGVDTFELQIPKIALDAAKKIPDGFTKSGMVVDELIWNGGGLCYADISSTGSLNKALLYSTGKKLNNLVCLPITVDAKSPEIMLPDWDHRKSIKFPRKIYQVTSVKISDRVFYGVRMDHKLKLGEVFVNFDDNVSLKHISHVGKKSSYIADLSLSPYIPEYLFVIDTGSVNISNFETGLVVDKYKKSSGRSQWWACQFGSHPRCFVLTRRNAVTLRDRRASARCSLTLLKSPSTAVLRSEKFTCYTNSRIINELPHLHYVASTHSLFLIDDRYAEHPVLTWKHQLMSKPSLMSAALWCPDKDTLSGSAGPLEDAVFLACRLSQETVAFHVRHSTLDSGHGQLSVSVSPPLRLPSPKELATFLVQKDHEVDLHCRLILELPLHGMCSIPFATDRRHLTVLYQTVDGNLYSQTLCQGAEDLPSASVMDQDQVINRASRWLATASNDLTSRMLPLALASDAVVDNKSMDADNLFMELMNKDPHSHSCIFCCKCDARTDTDVDGEEVCPQCHMSVKLTRTLSLNSKMSNLAIGCLQSPSSVDDDNFGLEREPPIITDTFVDSPYAMVRNILDNWKERTSGSQDLESMECQPSVTSEMTSQLNRSLSQCSASASELTEEPSASFSKNSPRKSLRNQWKNTVESSARSPNVINTLNRGLPTIQEMFSQSVGEDLAQSWDNTQDSLVEWTQRSLDRSLEDPDVIPPSQPLARMQDAGSKVLRRVTPRSVLNSAKKKARGNIDGF